MLAPVTNKFIFPNEAQALFSSLRHILDFVNSNLPFNVDAADLNFKLKVIITELLNNAVKHVGNTETIIHICIDDENIRIDKTDFGNPFAPGKHGSLLDKPVGSKVQLNSDPLHNIYASIENEMVVKFVCEENNNGQLPDINNLTEHFGLLIITKSADEFTYQYDRSSGLNTFKVSLKLR